MTLLQQTDPNAFYFVLPDFARQPLNGSSTEPIEINQYCGLSQRRIIATEPWHLGNIKPLETMDFLPVLPDGITCNCDHCSALRHARSISIRHKKARCMAPGFLP